MPKALARPVVFVIYRDSTLLPCIEAPGFAGSPPGAIVELSLHARLRRLMASAEPGVAPAFAAPVLFAPTWRRTVPSLLQLVAEKHPDSKGPVTLVCHTQDARYFVDTLGPVTATRLLWHPADRADHRLGELLGRVQRSALGPSLTFGGLYLSSRGRPATAEDWLETVKCPTLGSIPRMGRPRTGGDFRVAAGA